MRFLKLKWLSAVVLLMAMQSASAECRDQRMMNMFSDVAWDCIFPITILSIPIDLGNHPPDNRDSDMFCECAGDGIVGFGFVISYWEPARVVDTVKDPWCFPALGMNFASAGSVGSGYPGKGQRWRETAKNSFQHYHYYVWPIWAMIGAGLDSFCRDSETFDIAMVSEVRPDWGDDLTAAEFYPETSLMSNPFSVYACVADAGAAALQRTIDVLYWCMGAWGTTYPMTGNITTSDYVEANAGIAAKAMYVQARTAMLADRAINVCGPVPAPIWVKSHWRIQMADPQVDHRCHLIGHPGLLWTQRKNSVMAGMDNFSWVIFRKVKCCVVIY
jgi:conjugal transfer pilus assembly protein TraU